MRSATPPGKFFRSAALLLLLLCSPLLPVRAQPADSVRITAADSSHSEGGWLRPYAGFFIGGFPGLMQGGARVGVDLYNGVVCVGIDPGYVVGSESIWVPDVTYRIQILSPIPLFETSDTYLHGFISRIGVSRGYGGGIGFRKRAVPHFYGYIEAEIGLIQDVDENGPTDRMEWVPSFGRMGMYYQL